MLCPSGFGIPGLQPQRPPVNETILTGQSYQEWGKNVGLENGSLVRKEGMRDGGMSCVGKGLKRANVQESWMPRLSI